VAFICVNRRGEFVLATSLAQKKKNNSTQVQVNHPLHDATLLKQAVADSGQVVTRRVHQPGEQTYTMAAKACLILRVSLLVFW
jgi:hypothetical protein